MIDRLASLQKNGDSEWRRRVHKSSESDNNASEPGGAGDAGGKATSIADRMRLLATAEEGWKKRVNETSTKDANRFTVAGKMGKGALRVGRRQRLGFIDWL